MSGLYELDKGMVRSRLISWGEWKMRSGARTGFPKQSSFMNLSGIRSVVDYFVGDGVDMDFIRLTEIVDSLDGELRDAVRVEYLIAYRETSAKAHYCRCNPRTFYRRLERAHEIIARELNNLLHKCHDSGTNMASC